MPTDVKILIWKAFHLIGPNDISRDFINSDSAFGVGVNETLPNIASQLKLSVSITYRPKVESL